MVGTAADATTRIVPIGDSITKGMLDADDGGVHPTYRYWLYNKLRTNGYDVDFVGSWSDPDFPGYSFDKANEGHGGYTIGGIVDGVGTGGKLSTWLAGYYPDIALVLIGTNDVLANTHMDTRFSNLGRLVDTLRAKNPGIKIFVGKLPPTGDSYRNTNSGLIDVQLPARHLEIGKDDLDLPHHGGRPLLGIRRARRQPGPAIHPPGPVGRAEDRGRLVRGDQGFHLDRHDHDHRADDDPEPVRDHGSDGDHEARARITSPTTS